MSLAGKNTATSKIEIARKISQAGDITPGALRGFDRVYFGNEFCERLLPDATQFKRAINKVRHNKLKFTFLTPSATESGLNMIHKLASLLRPEDEVVVNDYGVMNMIGEEFKNNIVIGRVLGRIVFHAAQALERDPELLTEYISLLGKRIKMFEIDALSLLLSGIFRTKGIKFSFYAGPCLWTTTKRCAFNTNSKPMRKFAMCKRECLKNKALIENTGVNNKFLLKGNAIFGLRDENPVSLAGGRVDRVVY